MRTKLFAALIMTALSIYLLAGGAYERLGDKTRSEIEAARMRNVSYSLPPESAAPAASEPPAEVEIESPAELESCLSDTAEATAQESEEDTPLPFPAAREESPSAVSVVVDSRADEALETTISGGLTVKNLTDYEIDTASVALAGPGMSLSADGPQVLIIHTHSSEAYTPAGLDRYEASDSFRTEDTEYNIIRVGDELTALFQAAGLNVIHDRGIYDYPSYTGSYSRSALAVETYLRDYPSIAIVLDVHRDALGSGDVVYKTMAEESGTCASQVMLLVGTDGSGLAHPHWRRNLALALYMQKAVNDSYPTLMRPVQLVQQRYNQHLTTGSLIVEVGSSGNTLREALAAARLFSSAVAPALAELIE